MTQIRPSGAAHRPIVHSGTKPFVWAPRQASGCRNAGQSGTQRPILVGRCHKGYGEPDGLAGEDHTGVRLDVTSLCGIKYHNYVFNTTHVYSR